MQINPKRSALLNLEFDSGERVQQQNFGIRYQRKLSKLSEISTMVYLLRREFSNKLPFNRGGIVAFQRYGPGAGIRWIRKGQSGDHRLIMGVDFSAQIDDRERFNNLQGEQGDRVFNQREQVTSIGPYFREEWKADKDWSFTWGVRYDYFSFKVLNQENHFDRQV